MLRLGCYLVACASLSLALALFVHEVFGHAFVGTLEGGHVAGVFVYPFGGGHVQTGGGVATIIGGIVAELVLALVAFLRG